MQKEIGTKYLLSKHTEKYLQKRTTYTTQAKIMSNARDSELEARLKEEAKKKQKEKAQKKRREEKEMKIFKETNIEYQKKINENRTCYGLKKNKIQQTIGFFKK